MHYPTVLTVLAALTGLSSALPRAIPIDAEIPKGVPVKFAGIEARSNVPNGYITKRALDSGATVLKPIRLHPRRSLDRRAEVDFSKLDPAKQAQLVYGAPESDGTLLLANMTLYAPNGHPIVMMENFESLTSAIDCDGSDGIMSLTFKNDEALKYAMKKWEYINLKKEDQFIMIANHEGCGPNEERIPYTITVVKRDGLKVILTAKEEKWDKISGSFEIDFGKVGLSPGVQSVLRRDPVFDKIKENVKKGLDDIKKVGEKVGNGVKDAADKVGDGVKKGADKVGEGVKKGAEGVKKGAEAVKDKADAALDAIGEKIKDVGDGEFEKAINLPLATGQSLNGQTVFTDPTGVFTLECIECALAGSIKLTGHVAVDNFKPTILTFSAQPVDLKATVELGASLSAAGDDFVSPLQFSKNLVSLPLGGIVIPQVFSLGPKLDFELGASLSITGDAYFTFGIQASLPNTAKILANVLKPSASSSTGFEGAKAEPIPFTVETFTADVEVSAFALPLLSIGFEVLGGVFGAEVSLKFKVPSIEATLTAAFDAAGVCSDEEGASKTGITVESNAVLEGSLFVGTDKTVGETSVINQILFQKKFGLPSTCIEVDIPGLEKVEAQDEEDVEEEEEEEEGTEEEEEEGTEEEEEGEEALEGGEEEMEGEAVGEDVEEDAEEVVEEEEVEENVTAAADEEGVEEEEVDVAAVEEEEEIDEKPPKAAATDDEGELEEDLEVVTEEENEEVVEEEGDALEVKPKGKGKTAAAKEAAVDEGTEVEEEEAEVEEEEETNAVKKKGAAVEEEEEIDVVKKKGAAVEEEEEIDVVKKKGAAVEEEEEIDAVKKKGAMVEEEEEVVGASEVEEEVVEEDVEEE